jgi:hypothetical protein
MKRAVILCAALAFASVGPFTQTASSAPNSPLIVWQGGAEIVSLSSPGCDNLGYQVGDLAASVFRPRLDPAEPSSAISLTFHRAGHAYFRSGGASTDQMQGSSNYSSPWYSGRVTSTPGGNTGTIKLKIKPTGTISSAIDGITIDGTIANFNGVSGCTMGFKGAYRQRL